MGCFREGQALARPRGTRGAPLCYARRVSQTRPQQNLVGSPLPDLTLPDVDGAAFALRQFVPHRPLVLFFYVMNGTPG